MNLFMIMKSETTEIQLMEMVVMLFVKLKLIMHVLMGLVCVDR